MRHDCVSRVRFIGTAEEAAALPRRTRGLVLRRRMPPSGAPFQPGDVTSDSSCIGD